MIGRKLEEGLASIDTYWSSSFFQRVIVPPFADRLMSGSSGSKMSSELNVEQYSPRKSCISSCWSHWKSIGSLKKTKSGEQRPRKCSREYLDLENPSMFQVKQEKEASNEVFELSEGISLNEPLETRMVLQMKQKNRNQTLNQSQEELQVLLGHQQLQRMEWSPCWQSHWYVCC
jgi:hypothetical protein